MPNFYRRPQPPKDPAQSDHHVRTELMTTPHLQEALLRRPVHVRVGRLNKRVCRRSSEILPPLQSACRFRRGRFPQRRLSPSIQLLIRVPRALCSLESCTLLSYHVMPAVLSINLTTPSRFHTHEEATTHFHHPSLVREFPTQSHHVSTHRTSTSCRRPGRRWRSPACLHPWRVE